MSKLWEDLKENMREWSNSAVEKAEEMSRVAMAKTEEMTKISKLKFEIHQIQRNIISNYEKLGKLAYQQIKKDNNSTFSGNQEFFDIILRVDKSVPIKFAVNVMDIAYKNNIKVILATNKK